MIDPKICKNGPCEYHAGLSSGLNGNGCCVYILKTGKRRPKSIDGKTCPVYSAEPRKINKGMDYIFMSR